MLTRKKLALRLMCLLCALIYAWGILPISRADVPLATTSIPTGNGKRHAEVVSANVTLTTPSSTPNPVAIDADVTQVYHVSLAWPSDEKIAISAQLFQVTNVSGGQIVAASAPGFTTTITDDGIHAFLTCGAGNATNSFDVTVTYRFDTPGDKVVVLAEKLAFADGSASCCPAASVIPVDDGASAIGGGGIIPNPGGVSTNAVELLADDDDDGGLTLEEYYHAVGTGLKKELKKRTRPAQTAIRQASPHVPYGLLPAAVALVALAGPEAGEDVGLRFWTGMNSAPTLFQPGTATSLAATSEATVVGGTAGGSAAGLTTTTAGTGTFILAGLYEVADVATYIASGGKYTIGLTAISDSLAQQHYFGGDFTLPGPGWTPRSARDAHLHSVHLTPQGMIIKADAIRALTGYEPPANLYPPSLAYPGAPAQAFLTPTTPRQRELLEQRDEAARNKDWVSYNNAEAALEQDGYYDRIYAHTLKSARNLYQRIKNGAPIDPKLLPESGEFSVIATGTAYQLDDDTNQYDFKQATNKDRLVPSNSKISYEACSSSQRFTKEERNIILKGFLAACKDLKLRNAVAAATRHGAGNCATTQILMQWLTDDAWHGRTRGWKNKEWTIRGGLVIAEIAMRNFAYGKAGQPPIPCAFCELVVGTEEFMGYAGVHMANRPIRPKATRDPFGGEVKYRTVQSQDWEKPDQNSPQP